MIRNTPLDHSRVKQGNRKRFARDILIRGTLVAAAVVGAKVAIEKDYVAQSTVTVDSCLADVDGNSIVNGNDLASVAQHLNEPLTPGNSIYDVDQNGVINGAGDLAKIASTEAPVIFNQRCYPKNHSFENPESSIDHSKPFRWSTFLPYGGTAYNFQTDGHLGVSDVSASVVGVGTNPGCGYSGVGWRTEQLEPTDPAKPIDTTKNYTLKYWAKYNRTPLTTISPAAFVEFFDISGQPLGGEGHVSSNLNLPQDTWEPFTAITIGPSGDVPFPVGTKRVRVGVYAEGFSGDPCVDGQPYGTETFDDVSFNP